MFSLHQVQGCDKGQWNGYDPEEPEQVNIESLDRQRQAASVNRHNHLRVRMFLHTIKSVEIHSKVPLSMFSFLINGRAMLTRTVRKVRGRNKIVTMVSCFILSFCRAPIDSQLAIAQLDFSSWGALWVLKIRSIILSAALRIWSKPWVIRMQ